MHSWIGSRATTRLIGRGRSWTVVAVRAVYGGDQTGPNSHGSGQAVSEFVTSCPCWPCVAPRMEAAGRCGGSWSARFPGSVSFAVCGCVTKSARTSTRRSSRWTRASFFPRELTLERADLANRGTRRAACRDCAWRCDRVAADVLRLKAVRAARAGGTLWPEEKASSSVHCRSAGRRTRTTRIRYRRSSRKHSLFTSPARSRCVAASLRADLPHRLRRDWQHAVDRLPTHSSTGRLPQRPRRSVRNPTGPSAPTKRSRFAIG
jgi:hypothetical protein